MRDESAVRERLQALRDERHTYKRDGKIQALEWVLEVDDA